MMRPGSSTLAVCAFVVLAGCSGPEAPRERAVPDERMPAPPAPPPITVHVQVPEGAEEEAVAWAEDLRAAISAGHGNLTLAPPEDAQVVVRIDAVETGVDVTPAPEGEGEISVMKGALLAGVSAREFTLSYRGEARAQAEKLARNLRTFAVEGGAEPPDAAPQANQQPEEDSEDDEG